MRVQNESKFRFGKPRTLQVALVVLSDFNYLATTPVSEVQNGPSEPSIHTQSRSIATRLRTEQGFSTHANVTSTEKMPSFTDVQRVSYVDKAQKPTHDMITAIRAATILRILVSG